MLQIEILTLFPELFYGFAESSLVKKAQERGLLELRFTNIREFAAPPHCQVDDTPYGGGAGMLMKPEPLAAAIESAKAKLPQARVVLLTPVGEPFEQAKAERYAECPQLVLVCGRYEGVDQRVIDLLIDEELSLGDFVLMGGEVPAMAVVEAVTRLREEVLGNAESLRHETFSAGPSGQRLLEAPQYTRPPVFRGLAVPEVLTSGNHKQIETWREQQSLALTAKRRPDLLRK